MWSKYQVYTYFVSLLLLIVNLVFRFKFAAILFSIPHYLYLLYSSMMLKDLCWFILRVNAFALSCQITTIN